jgi:hypothetical protein
MQPGRRFERRLGGPPSARRSTNIYGICEIYGSPTGGQLELGRNQDRMDAEEFDAFYSGSVRRLTGQIYSVTGDLAEARILSA